MKSIQVTLENRLGLHARAASRLVQTADVYDAEVWLEFQGKKVNAKSIMGILMLAAPFGSVLQVSASGAEAGAAIDAIRKLVAERFGEPS